MTKFTIDDVLAHLFGAIEDKETRRQLERARREDPRVAWWFRELRTSIVAATAENEETSTVTAEPPDATEPQEPDMDVSPEALAAVRAMFRESAPASAPTAGTSTFDLALKLDEFAGNPQDNRPMPVSLARPLGFVDVDATDVPGKFASDDRPLPDLPVMGSITVEGGEVRLRYPAAVVPFGVVLVEAKEKVAGESRRLLGCQVAAMPAYDGPEGKKYRLGAVAVRDLVGEPPPPHVRYEPTAATTANLDLFRPYGKQIEQLRAEATEVGDTDLENDITALLEAMEP